MQVFELRIVTPDGLIYKGEAVMVHVRSIAGDIGVRARHIDFVTALGMGECRVDIDEQNTEYAACIGGLLAVRDGEVSIVATTFEWARDIDVPRAQRAKAAAEELLTQTLSEDEKKSAEGRLQRALVRIGVAKQRAEG